jgi:hypothetical protein
LTGLTLTYEFAVNRYTGQGGDAMRDVFMAQGYSDHLRHMNLRDFMHHFEIAQIGRRHPLTRQVLAKLNQFKKITGLGGYLMQWR